MYHQRTGHRQKNTLEMRKHLNETETYATTNNMKINTNKTKAMLFNSSRKFDYLPDLEFSNKNKLEIVLKRNIWLNVCELQRLLFPCLKCAWARLTLAADREKKEGERETHTL